MMNNKRVALVLEPEQMKAFTGFDGLYGACFINDGIGQAFIFMSREELMSAIVDYDVCPSGYSERTGILDLDTELEAIAQIADFSASQASQLADLKKKSTHLLDYIDYGPRYYRGVRIRLTTFGLDMMVGVELAESLGLKEGDKISLKASPCSLFFSVQKSDIGPELTRPMDEPEHFVIDRVFSNIPLFMELNDTDWNLAPYHLVDDRILISTNLKANPVQGVRKILPSVTSCNDNLPNEIVASKIITHLYVATIFVLVSMVSLYALFH